VRGSNIDIEMERKIERRTETERREKKGMRMCVFSPRRILSLDYYITHSTLHPHPYRVFHQRLVIAMRRAGMLRGKCTTIKREKEKEQCHYNTRRAYQITFHTF
jgi:hypothetical protein